MFTLPLCYAHAQTDSAVQQLQNLPKKYIGSVENKIDKYSSRISSKTEKTLVKLARWENKIKNLLQKTSPAAVEKLFAAGQPSFTTVLQKFREGKTITEGYKASYDSYRDELTTQLKYIEQQKQNLDTKIIKPVASATKKFKKLDDNVQQQEAAEAFIKERKKQLIREAVKYIGSSKYLTKINKEGYYYVETIKNYKEIFSDKKKAEQTVLTILHKFPGFKKFVQENSMLASLFGSPGASGSPLGAGGLGSLQTRASVNALIQNQIAAGGPNAQQQIMQNFQQAQSELNKLKDKILKAGGSSSDMEMPDFKPDLTKTKTFKQRMEFNTNFQFDKNNSYMPGAANIGLSAGYRLTDKFLVGLGASYRVGLGTINKIKITHLGMGLKSFVDWKMKKQFFITGGYEMNYNASFKNIAVLQDAAAWQQSGLLGITKKIAMKSKLIKNSKLQLLYDFLWKQQEPVGKQWVFRMGYGF